MTQTGKVVRVIPADVTKQTVCTPYEQIPVAAYCRVSTKQEEQLNSYEVQKQHYEELILSEAKWHLAGIFADRGISGTSLKKRDEFNRMLRLCQKGRIKMIITKSISRFARNTLDCIAVTRKLREIGVDVYFEEQNLHSIDASSEFYISIYGSVAQSESENISANVKWGKAQSAKNGNVSFNYKHFLGYRRGEDGAPEIVPEEAETVRTIYGRFLAGDSLHDIAVHLEAQRVPSPGGKQAWRETTIRSILSNEKYKGDAVLGKTYVENCLTKQLAQQADAQQAQAGLRSRLDEVYDALDALQNHPLAYDDSFGRQTFSRVIAVSKHLIRVVFPGGLEVEQEVE